jgi:hypothetical protein
MDWTGPGQRYGTWIAFNSVQAQRHHVGDPELRRQEVPGGKYYRRISAVVDFVAVKAQTIYKGRGANLSAHIPKHLETTNFNRLQ